MPSSTGGQAEGSPKPDSALQQLPPPVARAVKSFATAAQTKRIENICKAYQSLKSSANGLGIQQVLPLADKMIGQSAIALVVSAYSHERCFMCTDGSVVCESCSEEDPRERANCTHCNATGMAPCEFCEGSGWVGNDVIPREIRRAVWRSRLAHTHTILEQFAKTYTKEHLEEVSKRPAGDPERQKAIIETRRLAAKIHALAKSSAATNPEQLKHFATAEQKIRTCLKILASK